jgi:hypothetical protein
MDEKLATLLKYLPQLREQGVLTLRIDGVEATIAPAMPESKEGEAHASPRNPVDYGLPAGTQMPTLRGRR